MPVLFDLLPSLLAQAAAPKQQGDLFAMLVPMLGVVLLFYFIMVRPQQQQDKKRRQMIDAIKPGDRVLTTAGIYGVVGKIDPEKNRITIKCDDVKLTFTRASIAEVIEAKEKLDEAP